jgi:hypothetical protein
MICKPQYRVTNGRMSRFVVDGELDWRYSGEADPLIEMRSDTNAMAWDNQNLQVVLVSQCSK